LVPLIDARRGQVFAAMYGAGQQLVHHWGPLALDPAELLDKLRETSEIPLAAGDWALESRSYLDAAGIEIPAPDSGLHAVSALQICRLGRAVEPVAPEQVNPMYVRVPDAEISRSARVGQSPGDDRT
jgi:tRNA A37 threonylcarbamoyladenosine modification protein TsaB